MPSLYVLLSSPIAAESTEPHQISNGESIILEQRRPQPRIAEIIETKQLTASTHLIRVVKPEGFSFQASQSAALMIESDYGPQRHAMSIASSPSRDYLEWATRRSDSDFKKTFLSLQKGDHITLIGPKGDFLLEADKDAVFIAGGIGITPFRSMIDYITDEGLKTPVMLLYGNHSVDDIPFKQQFDELSGANPALEISYVISNPPPTPMWDYRVGHIDEDLLREVAVARSDAIYYVAGPPNMVTSILQTLAVIGIPSERTRHELFRGYD